MDLLDIYFHALDILKHPDKRTDYAKRDKHLTEKFNLKLKATKTDEFSEKFQTVFNPPPLIFGKSYCGFRDQIATKLRQKCVCSLWRDCYNINVLYDPISHEMHVVQQFNMVIG